MAWKSKKPKILVYDLHALWCPSNFAAGLYCSHMETFILFVEVFHTFFFLNKWRKEHFPLLRYLFEIWLLFHCYCCITYLMFIAEFSIFMLSSHVSLWFLLICFVPAPFLNSNYIVIKHKAVILLLNLALHLKEIQGIHMST